MANKLGYHLLACGAEALPGQIDYLQGCYKLRNMLKHDFFAATALYELASESKDAQNGQPKKIVLKVGRKQNFFGIPLLWLGHHLCQREISIIRHLDGIAGLPHLLAPYGRTGMIYEYIEGVILKQTQHIPDDFFDKLAELLFQIHSRNVVYVDMNKRSNIIVSPDEQPHLIDFQISLILSNDALVSRRLTSFVRKKLQREDLYHLFKHKRRLCPDKLRPEEETISRRRSKLIRVHQTIARPWRKVCRAVFKYLYFKGIAPKDNCPDYIKKQINSDAQECFSAKQSN